MDFKKEIREIENFPEEGIIFYDITTVLKNPILLRKCIDDLADRFKGQDIDIVVGPESRGFIFATPLAYKLNAGFVPVRKLGKLPAETIKHEYDLEYGKDSLEIHKDAIIPGQKVLIIDDLLATGGTISTTASLIEELGGQVVGMGFFIELAELNGRQKLSNYDVESLVVY